MSATRACALHMPVPSTSVIARRHPLCSGDVEMHGAHQPSGSPADGSVPGLVMPASWRTRHHRFMPWSNSRPRSRRYGAEHRAARAEHMTALRHAGEGTCAEPVCLYRSRTITPDMRLHLSHDPTGRIVLGLSHARCNTTEASKRARALQATTSTTPQQSPLRW